MPSRVCSQVWLSLSAELLHLPNRFCPSTPGCWIKMRLTSGPAAVCTQETLLFLYHFLCRLDEVFTCQVERQGPAYRAQEGSNAAPGWIAIIVTLQGSSRLSETPCREAQNRPRSGFHQLCSVLQCLLKRHNGSFFRHTSIFRPFEAQQTDPHKCQVTALADVLDLILVWSHPKQEMSAAGEQRVRFGA